MGRDRGYAGCGGEPEASLGADDRSLKEQIERRNWTQAAAARRFGVTQPRISDLMRGKIELFGLDTLVNMAVAAGLHVEMRIAEAA
jgi:predicted XRE-type DNA-binding protein